MWPSAHCLNYAVRMVYHRLFEWTMAVMMIAVGLHLAVWPRAVASSNFRYMLNIIDAGHLAVFYFAVGAARATALVANGHWPDWGPKLRAVASCFGAVVWAQMGFSLWVVCHATDVPPSIGIPIYGALVGAELFSTYKAAADVRSRR